MNENCGFLSDTVESDSSAAPTVCKVTFGLMLASMPGTPLASANDYYADCVFPRDAVCEVVGAERLQTNGVMQMNGVKEALEQAIVELRGKKAERDGRLARFFVRHLPDNLLSDCLTIDDFSYLTVGWDLARFRNVSVSFSGERIHLVGQLHMRSFAESFSMSEVEAAYGRIGEILYG